MGELNKYNQRNGNTDLPDKINERVFLKEKSGSLKELQN
jgi:hypothetical protein